VGSGKIQEMNRSALTIFCVFILFSGLAFTPVTSQAQTLSKFTGDSTKFIGELNLLFQILPDKEQKAAVKLMDRFIQKWNSEQYSPSKKQIIYSICNQMLKKRLKAFPDFYNYINSLDLIIDTHQPDPLFYEWSDVLLKLIKNKNNRPFLLFLDNTLSLFGENLVFKSLSTRWKIKNPDYHFLIDSVPMIRFSASDLICYSNDDSLAIYNTKGLYFPLSNRWIGQDGRVNWLRAGLDPAKVYADLHNYQIQMNYAKFVADSADFYFTKYFSSPLTGRYTDKVQADVDEKRASYPRFESYDKQIGIRDLFKNIDYLGGFSMEGAKIIGSGSNISDAQLVLKRDGKELIMMKSRAFIITPERIDATSTSIAIYYEYDSIYHPCLQMKYIDEKKELTISTDEQMRNLGPWFDSFHKIEIYCEELSWKMSESKIDFGINKGMKQQGKAVFESSNYYTLGRYDKLQGIDDQNPLAILKKFCEQKGKKVFTLDELCVYLQRPPEQVEAQLLNLSARGFLVYDIDDRKASVNEKLFDYVDAKNNKVDYDVIFFNSEVLRKSNAILTLDSFELRLQGIPSVFLSDSQQVFIYPVNQEIILEKNRNFLFSGKVEAGLFDIYAHNCFFNYGKFMLDMPDVDSMSFYVASRNIDPISGKVGLVKVKTNITDVKGELMIDDPNNKSGLKPYAQYPIFISKNDALVTWDKKQIQNGVYKKENFFYKVYPFKFTSLNSFPTDSLQFKGYLSSAGIFPEIEQQLKVRPDYSLGIETKTDTAGLPVYGGKGRFINKIDLSNSGLRGNGKIVYLNSSSISDNFIFYPDSMKALAKTFQATELLAEVECPAVHGDSVTETWHPYQDSLIISNSNWDFKKKISMYNDQSKFSGDLSLSPNGMTGNGTVRIKDAEMDSKRFLFKQKTFDANIANFRIKSYNLTDLSISTKNYQTHFDFGKRKGEFKSNVGISKVEFPVNKYTCTMDRFDWLIDSEEIALYNDKNTKLAATDTMSLANLIDFDFAGSEFISVHPRQDSLKFFALRAKYNLKTNLIRAEDVKIIKVADAAIFPDSGKVYILKDAQMKPLVRAIIIANQRTRYHQFYDAAVQISSRKKYTASGNYDYVDRNYDRQSVIFTKIAVDTSGQTYAEGLIPDSIHFKLSPEFAYTGEVLLNASRKNLIFDGGFRPLTDCFRNLQSGVKFRSEIDPANIQLPVNRPLRDIHNEKLLLGIVYSNAKNKIFPAFFIKKQFFNDSIMIAADGILSYNDNNGTFQLVMPEKLKMPGETYNVLTLSTEKCLLHLDGRINLNLNSGPLKMETFGGINYFTIPDSINVRVATAFNFPFPETAQGKFSLQVKSINLEGITVTNTPYYNAMKNLMGQKEFDKVKSDLELLGKFKKFPEELTRTIFFADVNLKWDSANKSWVSYGPIGIGNIGKVQVNRYAGGIIEFTKKKNGDEFTIYLELTKNDWYFFNYRNNILQVLSSNLEFNDQITGEQKSKAEQKRIDNIAKGFRYIIATDRKKRDFLRKFTTEE
jgi:hypothetical protein